MRDMYTLVYVVMGMDISVGQMLCGHTYTHNTVYLKPK